MAHPADANRYCVLGVTNEFMDYEITKLCDSNG